MSANFSLPRRARRVAVTAMGVISPLGQGLVATLESLRAGTDAVAAVPGTTGIDTSKCRSKTAGNIQQWSQVLNPAEPDVADDFLWRRPRAVDRLHPVSHWMIEAATEARKLDPAFAPELAVIGTTSGGMSFGQAFHRAQIDRRHLQKRARVAGELHAAESGERCAGGEWVCMSRADHRERLRLRHERGRPRLPAPCAADCIDRVLCGGYDMISELVFTGFDSLQAATAEKVRPFDKNRSGLVLGEGAALLCLEEWESAQRRGAPILAEITGYGAATDNHHLTQPNPSGIGPRLAMERALADARRRAEEIDYINAHGTATAFNDATEGAAISQLFGSRVPVSSTKSMMGHALGAAGAIEAVFSVLALQHQFLPPNINYETPDPAWRLNIVANEAREANVCRVVSNSFGFGGSNASIVLERL